jgi:hypothetical protein
MKAVLAAGPASSASAEKSCSQISRSRSSRYQVIRALVTLPWSRKGVRTSIWCTRCPCVAPAPLSADLRCLRGGSSRLPRRVFSRGNRKSSGEGFRSAEPPCGAAGGVGSEVEDGVGRARRTERSAAGGERSSACWTWWDRRGMGGPGSLTKCVPAWLVGLKGVLVRCCGWGWSVVQIRGSPGNPPTGPPNSYARVSADPVVGVTRPGTPRRCGLMVRLAGRRGRG